MKRAIFKVPGTWEIGLFKMTPSFYDGATAEEVREQGYARIPITEAFIVALPKNIMSSDVTWYFSSLGGRWKLENEGTYRVYVLRDGEGVVPVGDLTPIIIPGSTIGFDAKEWTLEKLRKEA